MTRRGFLKGLLATSALVVAPVALARPDDPYWIFIVHPDQEARILRWSEPTFGSWEGVRFITSERVPGWALP